MVIHVYHPYRQPEAQNHCLPLNGRCSHVCLPAPQLTANSAKTSCACPRGLRLDNDNLNCIHDRKLFCSSPHLLQLFVSFFISFSFHFLCLASYKGVKAFNSLNPPPTNFKNQVHANTFDEKDSFEFSTVAIEPDYNFEFDTEAAEDIMTTTTGFKRISQVLLLMMLMEKHVFCRLL